MQELGYSIHRISQNRKKEDIYGRLQFYKCIPG